MSKNFIIEQLNQIYSGGLPLLPQKLYRLSFVLLVTPLVLFIRLLHPLILIRFGRLISGRIGHFASNTELYLCNRDVHRNGKWTFDIFYNSNPISNKQLKIMWGRALCVLWIAKWLDKTNQLIPGGTSHLISLSLDRDIDGLFMQTSPHLSFTLKEERLGRDALQKLGIQNGHSFICFHARSQDYLKTVFPEVNWDYHNYRDSNIHNYIPAVEELAQRGYFAVRMGAIVKKPLEITNPGIIDYATKHRTEFLDIFLGAKCHFYLGDPCGFHSIPMIFRRPLAIVNMIPLEYAPTWSPRYLFIPKKLWLRKEHRLLTFHEILGSEIGRFCYSKQYEQLGIEVIENTPEEITALAIEMDQRLKGEWQASEDDEELQQRFWALFKSSELNRVIRSRIGAEFLRQNKELLE